MYTQNEDANIEASVIDRTWFASIAGVATLAVADKVGANVSARSVEARAAVAGVNDWQVMK